MELDFEKHAELINSLHEWWSLIEISYRIGLPKGFYTPAEHARLQLMGEAGVLNADLSMAAPFREALDKALAQERAGDRASVIKQVAVRYRDWYLPALAAGGKRPP